jgi:hypothetical protein
VLEEVVVGEVEVPRSKAAATGSSSRDASSDRSGEGTNAQDVESRTVDPRESTQSYDFGASTITVGRIWQLDALGYFSEGSAREPEEEVLSEPANDEAIVFRSFLQRGSGCCCNQSSLISWLSFECSFTS